MEHHYILYTTMRVRGHEFLCPFGAICAKEGLNDILKRADVIRYKIKLIDDDPVADWEKSEWTPVV